MSPVFLSVEIPSSPGPAAQPNDSLIISSARLPVCGVRVSVTVCAGAKSVSRLVFFLCMCISVCV